MIRPIGNGKFQTPNGVFNSYQEAAMSVGIQPQFGVPHSPAMSNPTPALDALNKAAGTPAMPDIALQSSPMQFKPQQPKQYGGRGEVGMPVKPQGLLDPQQPQQPEQAPSFMDKLTSSDGLTSIGSLMLSMSQDPSLQRIGAMGMQQAMQNRQSNRTLDFLKAKGVDEATINALRDNPQMINAYASSLLKQPKNAQSALGKIQADYEAGAYGKVGSPEALAMRDRSIKIAEKAGSTDIALNMGGTYADVAAKGVAESDLATKSAAQNAVRVIPKLQETLSLIESPDTNIGLFANLQTGIDRFIAELGGEEARKSLSDTQILQKYLGSDVFAALGALGLGSKNMDTPAEREFLMEVMTGKITDSRGALKRLAEERLSAQQDALDKYNRMVDSGEFGYFKGTPLESRFGKLEYKPYEKQAIAAGAIRQYNGQQYVNTGEGDPSLPPDQAGSSWKLKR
jgi:hypothetical protein